MGGSYPNVGLADYTCNPFHFHFRGPIQPVDYYIDDPGPATPCPCNCTINVNGCNNQPLLNTSVTIKTGGGATVGSGTTDASGNAVIQIDNSGSYTVVLSHPSGRFAAATLTSQALGCSTKSYTMAAASGYHCLNSTTCAWPLKDTLNYTDGVTSTTLIWNSTGTGTWAKRTTVPYTGYSGVGCSCPNITTFMNYELHAGGAIGAICDSGSWVSGSGDPVYSGCCPNHNGGGTCEGSVPTGTVTSLTCPESGALLITGTLPMGPEGGGPDCCGSVGSLFPTGMVYGCSSSSYTITE